VIVSASLGCRLLLLSRAGGSPYHSLRLPEPCRAPKCRPPRRRARRACWGTAGETLVMSVCLRSGAGGAPHSPKEVTLGPNDTVDWRARCRPDGANGERLRDGLSLAVKALCLALSSLSHEESLFSESCKTEKRRALADLEDRLDLTEVARRAGLDERDAGRGAELVNMSASVCRIERARGTLWRVSSRFHSRWPRVSTHPGCPMPQTPPQTAPTKARQTLDP
jgi:hypothetical protein